MTTAFTTPCGTARNVPQLTGRQAGGYGVIWGGDYLARNQVTVADDQGGAGWRTGRCPVLSLTHSSSEWRQ